MFNENISSAVELSDEQLQTVNGGLVVVAVIAILIGLLLPAAPTQKWSRTRGGNKQVIGATRSQSPAPHHSDGPAQSQ